jgi:hypothetical protein
MLMPYTAPPVTPAPPPEGATLELVRKFVAGFKDGSCVNYCTDDATFNSPGAPPMPIAAVSGMMQAVQASGLVFVLGWVTLTFGSVLV